MSEIYTDPPQSRNEAIIKSTIDGTEYTDPPQSRMEDLLLELKEAIEEGGGGGGTKDYSQLTNKPSINDVELSGNKTSSDLGLMPEQEVDTTPTESSENLITSGGVWTADKGIKDRLQGSKQASSTSGTIEIPDYGMTESIDMYFKPKQDLHGYDKPWAGGAGKNILPLTVDNLKSTNTDGTWSGNVYTLDGATFEILVDSDNNVQGIKSIGVSTQKGIYLNLTLETGTYTLSSDFTEQAGANDTLITLGIGGQVIARGNSNPPGSTFTLESAAQVTWVLRRQGSTEITCRPMIRLSTESDATFEPYSNICPISGQDNATFSWTDSYDIENEASMDFGQTYYGGFCQFATGAIYSTFGVVDLGDLTWSAQETGTSGIYRMRALLSHKIVQNNVPMDGACSCYPLVSANDTYSKNTGISGDSTGNYIFVYDEEYNTSESASAFQNAMSGVQLAYELATPTMAVVRKGDMNLTDDYPMQFNGWLASVTYQPKNTVLLQAKEYTNQEIAKLGLPQPPTTDGTYHLECSVSGGIPTIRWVSNS